jgi:CRISPR-associated protein Cas1
MSFHILHLLSPNLRVRVKLDQLHIEDREKGAERTVPLADVAVIVSASPDLTVTAGALRRMAELNVLFIVCNEKFEPCALTLPYYRATNTELLRRQIEWTPEWRQAMWRQIITAKIRNQAANLAHLKRAHSVLSEIAERCDMGSAGVPPAVSGVAPETFHNPRHSSQSLRRDAEDGTPEACAPQTQPSLAAITPSKRAGLHADTPDACESRAARHYWKHLLPRLRDQQQTDETRRVPGTRQGVNGMLDYGYAIVRTAVLRSLAAHGFIAAIGIAHAPKAGSFALADDLVEPLRPWIDRELRQFVQGGPRPMEEWMKQAVRALQSEVAMGNAKVRLLNAIDLYVQSFATATLSRANAALKFPMLK